MGQMDINAVYHWTLHFILYFKVQPC